MKHALFGFLFFLFIVVDGYMIYRSEKWIKEDPSPPKREV